MRDLEKREKEIEDSAKERAEALVTKAKIEAEKAIATWRKLGEYLMVKYLDDAIKGEKNGQFDGNHKRIPNKVTRPGYSSEYIEKEFVRPNPKRFRVKTAEEMDNRK